MYYIDHWDKSKERYEALWENEIIDRCCVSIFALKDNNSYIVDPYPTTEDDAMSYFTDGERILKRETHKFENLYYGGDAFPCYFLYLGPTGHAGFYKGVKYGYKNSVWYEHIINDIKNDALEFDPESFLYKKTMELSEYLATEGKGKFFVSMPDVNGNLDALAGLRGSENLMIDMMMTPEPVHERLAEIQEVWKKTITDCFELTKETNDGGSCVGWLQTWAPGMHSQMQCDMSAMISPEWYGRFAMPELIEQAKFLDFPLYHLDGQEQIRHLDQLLSIKELKMIQWTQVKGQPSVLEHIPTLQRIQAAGKGLMIHVDPREVAPLLEALSSKGLYLLTIVPTETDAKYLMKIVEKLSHE